MESLLEPTPDLVWLVAAEGFDPLREAMYESRFSISNGLLGLRAGRPVSRGERWAVPQRAYLAGLFDIPGPEHPIPALVPAPGWQQIRIMLPGGPLVRHPLGLLPEEFPGESRTTNFRYYDRAAATAVPSAAPCMGWSRPGWGTRSSRCGISNMRWRSIWQITTRQLLGGGLHMALSVARG
jgi:hypothetical protein